MHKSGQKLVYTNDVWCLWQSFSGGVHHACLACVDLQSRQYNVWSADCTCCIVTSQMSLYMRHGLELLDVIKQRSISTCV